MTERLIESGDGPAACTGPVDDERRFFGMGQLFGPSSLLALRSAHVCVIGVGGVGSWTVEALVRSAVGRLTLIDLDHVAESNLNRQIHALQSTVGAAKVQVMKARIADISPHCAVAAVEDFLTVDNAEALVPEGAVLIDAIDQVRPKAALAALARARGQALLMCGAAGGRRDPLRLARGDLALVRGDALLASVRARLRRDHGYAREKGRPFGVPVICSDEPVSGGPRGQAGAPLACAGYGSVVTVTAAMGFAAAAWAISAIVDQKPSRGRRV
jgi:tRNA A37 threonylcarbamoyladenosine dehydratase